MAPQPQLTGAGGSATSAFLATMDPATGAFTKGFAFSCTEKVYSTKISVNADGEVALAVSG